MPRDPPKIGSRENFKEKDSASQTILKNEKSVQKKHGGKRVENVRNLDTGVKKMRLKILPVHEVARTNFLTRFSNSSGNFKPFGKKNRRNPSIFSPGINGWSLVRCAGSRWKKVDKIAISGPILMIFFLNRLNFSRRTRKSGWKIHRSNAWGLKPLPGFLKNVTYNKGEFVCVCMEVSQLVWISFQKFFFWNGLIFLGNSKISIFQIVKI